MWVVGYSKTLFRERYSQKRRGITAGDSCQKPDDGRPSQGNPTFPNWQVGNYLSETARHDAQASALCN
jgi:hypothetical protein